MTALTSPSPMPPRSRRFGGLLRLLVGLAASVALIVTVSVAGPEAPAYAEQYPTWAQVQQAKKNQSDAQAEATRLRAILRSLTANAQAAQQSATAAGNKMQAAQEAYFAADQKYEQLKTQSDALAAQATKASTRAGRVAAQLYRSGGHNLTVSLLFASADGSSEDPRDLLSDLGSMTKLTESTSDLWAQAQQAKNTASAASDQAKSALAERTRLQAEAQATFQSAVDASVAAQQAVQEQQEHATEVQAMLSALTSKAKTTIAQYQKGVAVAKEKARLARIAAAKAAAARAGAVGGQGWAVPVAGVITAGYGPRAAPCAGCSTWHEGVDIAAGYNTPIHAAHAGNVTYAGWASGYGNFVIIDDGDGMSTAYGHIIDGGITVSIGQHVTAGQVIAHVGSTGHSTGAHLHFEVRQNGIQINPIVWMAGHGATL